MEICYRQFILYVYKEIVIKYLKNFPLALLTFFEKLYENVTKIHFILVGSERFTLWKLKKCILLIIIIFKNKNKAQQSKIWCALFRMKFEIFRFYLNIILENIEDKIKITDIMR